MLARINSAAGGIKEYLETGKKRGREFERDLIDQRVPITGDIDLLDSVIGSIETNQEGDARYLHITLGFAEQFTEAEVCAPGQINAALMVQVTEAYREALMAAYDPSEYMFYAEAHIPKVTHELNARTGDYETRLPHIHIVIPTRNLESDRYLNPFGYRHDETVADAIQEDINLRFGLRSPRDARRDPAEPSHPLGRHEARFEGQSPKQLRAYLDDLVASQAVNTFEELIEAAQPLGVVTVRQGKTDTYLNIKPDWADKGINLQGLGRAGFDETAAKLRQAQPAPDFAGRVQKWRERGSFEARYVELSPKIRKAYKAMDEEGKAAFLAGRRAETAERLARYDEPLSQQITDAAADAIRRAKADITEDSIPLPHPVGWGERLQLLIKELKNGRPQRDFENDGADRRAKPLDGARVREDLRGDGSAIPRRDDQDTGEASDPLGRQLRPDQDASRDLTDAQLKGEASPVRVLEIARKQFGIDPTAYEVGAGKDGTPRLIHEGRQYNLGDFFTKHLKRPWAEAREFLIECHPSVFNNQQATGDRSNESRTHDHSAGPEGNAGLLRRAAAAIARGKQVVAGSATVERYLERRSLGAALETALRRLRQDRPQDEAPLTTQERIDRAGFAISRGRASIKSDEQIRLAIGYRQLGRAITTTLRRLSVARPETRISPSVVTSLAAQAQVKQMPADKLKEGANPALVLSAARDRYGINPDEYSVGTGFDGSPRIIHKDKQYNVGDFFTKHLNRPWSEAEPILRSCYHASMSDALPPPDKVLWRQFSDWRNRQFTDSADRKAKQDADFRARVLASREKYKEAKTAALVLPRGARAAAVARARADQFMAQQVIAAERAASREEGRIPSRNAHYREYLADLAGRGDTVALTELRRMAPHEQEPNAKIFGRRSQAVFPLPTYSVDARGAVTYKNEAGAIVRDSVQGVAVLKAESKAYDAALRVAVARYGRSLTLTGDEKFVANMTAAARRTGLEITIRDASKPRSAPVVLRARGSEQTPDR
ncbi:hypothetical protein J2W32_006503 [Variovorax boronicumulans]|uniref:Large polyvalent protein-associated domain-containing protein n=1 Tax=Variovorax boronicumulans TaxID=436515 RepID=A0AAW8D447_9BURK|nr:LPD7 domain-containing protein [Variovorax boronicumulans]MDP9897340.1 hypothetical protein [Variovorax boronicumulans]MDQ0057426.1 hypothetical protein [Variovorax boronicumulans]